MKKKKVLLLTLAFVLVIAASVGGTLAWITATASDVNNTFTVGDINIALDEAKTNKQGQWLDASGNVVTAIADAVRVQANEYKMVPAKVFPKDPTVTVKADSEKCWVFIRAIETDNTLVSDSSKPYIHYELASGWSETTVEGKKVYYKLVDSNTADQSLQILAGVSPYTNGGITVDENATKADMEAVSSSPATKTPKLDFKACAVQYEGLTDVTAAAAKIPSGFLN